MSTERKLHDELDQALTELDIPNTPSDANHVPAIWKISHGANGKGVKKNLLDVFEKRKVVVVDSLTSGMGGSKITQGQNFMYKMKKGDFFYLCYGNSIRLLGKITTD